jgi:glycosyltransferase involved in cell wall biosynthesis
MSVVHVISRLVPGGAENQLQGIVERSKLAQEIIELQPVQELSRAAALRRLHQLIASRNPGVVVAWLDRSQLAVAASPRHGRQLVAAIQGMPRRTGLAAWTMRGAFRRFDRLVSNSEASREATRVFARPFSLQRFDVIPNGVDLHARPASQPREPGKPVRIAFIGRNDPAKGLDVLLRALGRLDDVAFEAVLVGDGVPDAVAAAAPAYPHTIHPRVADPWDRVGHVDVLALPSLSEASPNVIVEAFARGIPVVATTAGGTSELVEKGRALAVRPGDPNELRAALANIARDPGAARGRALVARDYVERVHRWDRVVEGWDMLLQEELSACG